MLGSECANQQKDYNKIISKETVLLSITNQQRDKGIKVCYQALLKKEIQKHQKQICILINYHDLQQAQKMCDRIDQLVKQYFKINSSSIKDIQKIRTLHRLKKQQQLILFMNKALILHINNKPQKAQQLMLLAIEEIQQLILAQNIRSEFIDKQQTTQKEISAKIIEKYKEDLAKFYYIYALITQKYKLYELAFASLLKAVQLITLIIKESLKIKFIQLGNKNYCQAQELSEQQQLLVLCLFLQRTIYEQQIKDIIFDDLVLIVNQFCIRFKPQIFNQQEDDDIQLQCHNLSFDKWIHLQLDSPQALSPQNMKIISLEQNKGLILLCCKLLSTLLNRQNPYHEDNIYEKQKVMKKIISIHIVQIFIYQQLLKNKIIYRKEIEELIAMYQTRQSNIVHKRSIMTFKKMLSSLKLNISNILQERVIQSPIVKITNEKYQATQILQSKQGDLKTNKIANQQNKKIIVQKMKRKKSQKSQKTIVDQHLKQRVLHKYQKQKLQYPHSAKKYAQPLKRTPNSKKMFSKNKTFLDKNKRNIDELKKQKIKEQYLMQRKMKIQKRTNFLDRAINTHNLSFQNTKNKEKQNQDKIKKRRKEKYSANKKRKLRIQTYISKQKDFIQLIH